MAKCFLHCPSFIIVKTTKQTKEEKEEKPVVIPSSMISSNNDTL